MTSLLQTLPRHAAFVTAFALVAAGLSTTVALTMRARTDLDQALLVAAKAHADPHLTVVWEAPGSETPVDIQTWTPQTLPGELRDLGWEALAEELPHWLDHQGERVVLLTIEPVGTPDEEDESLHPHRIVVASAPQVGIFDAARPFLLFYGPFAGLTSLAAAWAHRRTVARELRPLNELAAKLRHLGPDRLETLTLETLPSEEVHTVSAAVDGLLTRLGRALDGHRRFTEVAAHELRSPLAALLGELEALRRSDDPSAVRALALGRRMASTTDAILALSRLSADEIGRQRTAMRPSEIILEALDRTRVELQEVGMHAMVKLDEDPEIQVQANLCVTAVENLLRNAARHAPGSTVQIRTLRAEDGLVIEVQDSGPGIAEEGPARRGLGLRIVDAVAQHHGGRFSIGQGPRGGTIARMWFPACSEPTIYEDDPGKG